MSPQRRRWLVLAASLAAALWAAPAQAVYQCGDRKDDCPCGGNNPYPCCDNGGNCTWSAWDSACCSWKVALPGWGNANQWAGNAKSHPSYDALSYPVTSSIACNASGTYGHVAWVTGFSTSQVTVTEQNCWGNYGTRSATYSTASFTGGFIVRTGTIQCRPGDTQTQSCGNCGQQTRGCGKDGQWGAWGTCSAQGVCSPGKKESLACGDCGVESRACRTDCSWEAWGGCQAVEPDGGLGPCDTGESGACAAGVLHCGDGGVHTCAQAAQPELERCNGRDDDCDGTTDEGEACAADAGAEPPVGTEAPGGAGAPRVEGPGLEPVSSADPVLGSCGCQVAPAPLWALLLLGVQARQRARRG
ncbi:MAG: CHAP domain-containing protein [Myxococcales bacterium]|nr:CHAP domain-containing protein [Myxococcales bacterium]